MRTGTRLIVAAALCFGSLVQAESGLVLHYTFEEGQGNVLQDHSGHNLHGKIHGAKWVKGDFGHALAFDGTDDYVECPYSSTADTSAAFTVEAWVYPRRHGGGIFCRVTGGAWKDLRLSLTTFYRKGKEPYSLFCLSDGENHNRAKLPALALKTWTHLAARFDGAGVRLFVNGEIANRFTVGFKPKVEGVPIWIGRSFGVGDRHYFCGMIREVRYYSRALSNAEIKAHYESGKEQKGIALARRISRPAGKPRWAGPRARTVGRLSDGKVLLPTEQTVKPAGKQIVYPGRPLDMALSPNGKWLAVTNLRSVTLIALATGERQIVSLPDGGANSFHGIVFLPDSRTFYCSGARGEVFVFEIEPDGKLAYRAAHQVAKRAVCGLALSDDRKHLYVADSVGNSLVICDAATLDRVGEVPVGVAPYSVAVGPHGKVYLSNWGGRHATRDDFFSYTYRGKDDAHVVVDRRTGVVNNGTVSVVRIRGSGDDVGPDGEVLHFEVGRFPCQILLNASRSRLFVANANDDTVSIVDTASDEVLETVSVRPDLALPFGSQPNALALSADGTTLYVANATNNAIAVIRLGRSADVAGGPERSRLAGMIPTGWFPGALEISHDGRQLYVANVRGLGAGFSDRRGAYHVGDFIGLVSILDVPDGNALAEYTRQVSENNRLQACLLSARPRQKGDRLVPVPAKPGESSVFEHVIYIIRENHTYDMDLGDVGEGNGEPRLCSCGETLTPNAHAIARQFVLLDNYHVPSVQSPTGHVWVSQGITTSYWEKGLTTWPRAYSYTGQDALAFAGCEFIWTNALKHGLTFRNYGENVSWSATWADGRKQGQPSWIDAWNDYRKGTSSVAVVAKANIPSLKPHTATYFPGYGYIIPDVRRAQIFIEDLKRFEQEGNFPNLIMVFLPNNHTSGNRPGLPTAPAQVADNDMALGMIVDAVSHSKFWPKTVIFTTEDDPWNGSDHVAGSRSLCFIVSPYTKRGAVVSECYTLCGLLKTIELILGLPMMNQLDLLAEPMTECFTPEPNFAPYACIPSKIPLDTLTPKVASLSGRARFWAQKSMELPLVEEPDSFPEQLELFKRLFWYATVGYEEPYAYVRQGEIVTEDPTKWIP